MNALRLVSLLPAGLFPDLLFNSEDGGEIILRKIGFQRNTRIYIPEDKTLRHGALGLTA
jgi:hypothetical protein